MDERPQALLTENTERSPAGNHCNDPPRLDSTELPWITPEVRTLLEKALHKDPGKRFQSMDEILRAIRASLESIDPGGKFVINRREYLSRFARDPVKTAMDLRRESIDVCQRRGLRLQGMGLDKLEDALLEFRYVRVLDPENKKANTAIRDLEKQWEESGQQVKPDAGRASEVDLDTTRPLPVCTEEDLTEISSPTKPRVPLSIWVA